MEIVLQLLRKLKIKTQMLQQFHFCLHIQNKLKIESQRSIFASMFTAMKQ
jgi:hypothetical protein